jgi:disulfide bond formation protein DsbB
MRTSAVILALSLVLATSALAQEASHPEVQDTPPAQAAPTPGYPAEGQPAQKAPDCREINKGGPIAGIVVASVFWYVLPMSIPVWITQAKKLKRRKAEIAEQQLRGCP